VTRGSLIIRVIWACCLVVAAINHARILVRHGIGWDYDGVGRVSAAYWSSLTIVDPIAAGLLLARPRAGIVITIILIVTNVGHNLTVTARDVQARDLLTSLLGDPYLLSQIGFMLFVLVTAGIAWPSARRA